MHRTPRVRSSTFTDLIARGESDSIFQKPKTSLCLFSLCCTAMQAPRGDYEFLVAEVRQLEAKFAAQGERLAAQDERLAAQDEQLATQAIMLQGFVRELADLKAKRHAEQSHRVIEVATQAAINTTTESAMHRLNESLCSNQVQHHSGAELWVVLT